MFESTSAIHISMPIETLCPIFVNWLENKNLYPSFLEIFYLPADCKVRHIHTDLDHITKQASKINYIIGGEDAPMQWFSVNNSTNAVTAVNYAPTYTNKDQTSPFLYWTREQCTLINETILSGPNLIHAGIPHVVFTKTKPRIAISVVLKDVHTKQRLSCEEVIARL